MGGLSRRLLARATREAGANGGPLPKEFMDSVWSHFDQGTQRAMLRLYRSSSPDALARAGAGLGRLQGPSLVVWGECDVYVEPRWAGRRLARLPCRDAGAGDRARRRALAQARASGAPLR